MFDFRNVRIDIESLLNCNQPDSSSSSEDDDFPVEETVQIIKEIISNDKHWAIFIDPEGRVDYASTYIDHDISFLEKLRLYKKLFNRKG